MVCALSFIVKTIDTRSMCSNIGVTSGSLGNATHFMKVNNTVKTLNKSVAAVKAGPTNVNVCQDGSMVASFDCSTCKVRDGCRNRGSAVSGGE